MLCDASLVISIVIKVNQCSEFRQTDMRMIESRPSPRADSKVIARMNITNRAHIYP
jgi:hypothetical protein